MDYGDFTLEEVGRVLGIQTSEVDLFPHYPHLSTPNWVIETLKNEPNSH